MCYTSGMKQKTPYLERELRRAIERTGLSQNKLAEVSGVSQTVISRFLRGERTLTLPIASKLVEVLGLELRPKRSKHKKRQVQR